GECGASKAGVVTQTRERDQRVHHADCGAYCFARTELVGSSGACAMKHGRTRFQVWGDGPGDCGDRVVGNGDDDRVRGAYVRWCTDSAYGTNLERSARLQRPPQPIPDPAAADDEDLHVSSW
ncbi:MAG: hypothetical protein WBM74_13165, partial [Polyangiales bacterium]